MPKYVVGLCVYLALLVTSMPGQAVFGNIVGTVTDPSGGAVANVKVTIRDVNKGVSYSVVTNAAGNYSQTHLIVGVYEVRFEVAGFETTVQHRIWQRVKCW